MNCLKCKKLSDHLCLQLDPVVPTLNRDAGSLIPAPRRSSQDKSELSNTVNDGNSNEAIQGSYIEEKEVISPSAEERVPLLKLLAPPQVSVDSGENVNVYTSPTTANFGSISILIPRRAWVKVIKSAILLAKVSQTNSCMTYYTNVDDIS